MPVITISRMFGSGGSLVAERVAASLGWTLLDNALIERVAVGLHMTPANVEAIEERTPSLAERFADALAFSSQEMLAAPLGVPLPPTEQRILEVTHRVIDEAVARGSAVLVGRGAQAWLSSRRDAIHVFCVTTREAAIARVVERERVSIADAEKLIDETNRQRAEYVRRNWRRDWSAASNYDLCVNTAWLGIDGAAQLIVDVARKTLPTA